MAATAVIRCSIPNCKEAAQYKLAAPWSDGRFTELKTYGHACAEHVGQVFRSAEDRRSTYKAAPGEQVGELGIYRSEKGWLDWQLQRDTELETRHRSWGSGAQGV